MSRRRPPETQPERLVRMRGEGMTYQAIADELGVTRQRIHQLLRRLGAAGPLPKKERPPKPPRVVRNKGLICLEPGCTRPADCRGRCHTHYARWMMEHSDAFRQSRAAASRRWIAKPGVREHIRERTRAWRARPEVRARLLVKERARRADPEARRRKREKNREYRSRPEVREYLREKLRRYRAAPANAERLRAWNREYTRRRRLAADAPPPGKEDQTGIADRSEL